MTLDQQKIEARLKAKAVRKSIGDDYSSRSAAVQLVQWAEPLCALIGTGVVAGYFPKGSEMDIRPLLDRLRQLGCSVALPVMVGPERPMEFRLWNVGEDLKAGPFGILEPGPSSPVVRPTVVLAPMLAFDRKGRRLGYGGGYYDRTLESLGGTSHVTVVGIAYAAQEIDHVPHDSHDHPLDYVATETELLKL